MLQLERQSRQWGKSVQLILWDSQSNLQEQILSFIFDFFSILWPLAFQCLPSHANHNQNLMETGLLPQIFLF